METLWFCCVALMLAVYVVLDGFDIGAGIVHLFVARSDEERQSVLASIGPVWDGNEVWLLASGGTLYFAFPALYASSFSGFYLPLMMVLWLLIGRGLSIELRGHAESELWKSFWDAGFAISSILLAIFFGAALGNVVRGVPLDASGFFFLPLWTNFQPGREAGILDWYTVTIGIAALATLAMHGALWVALKTDGELHERTVRFARGTWASVAAMMLIVTGLSFKIQPHLAAAFAEHRWGWVFPVIAIAGLLGVRVTARPFYASCLFIAGMLASVAFGMYPYVLPSNGDPAMSLDVHNAAAAQYGLEIGIRWWIPGMILAAGYFVYVYRGIASPKIQTPRRTT